MTRRRLPDTFISVAHGFPKHRKTVELSDKAFRHLVTIWCENGREGYDGKVTERQLLTVFTPRTLAEVVAVGFIDVVEGGYQLHDADEWQETTDSIADLRKVRQEAGRLGGKAKAERMAKAGKRVASATAKEQQTLPDVDVDVDVDEQQQPTTKASPANSTPVVIASAFDRFWAAYPRKVGKDGARKMFATASRRVDPEVIVAGAERLRADPNLPATEYVPHPSTWLNAGRWDDEPYPTPAPRRGAVASTTDQRVQATLDLAEMYRAQEQSNDHRELTR